MIVRTSGGEWIKQDIQSRFLAEEAIVPLLLLRQVQDGTHELCGPAGMEHEEGLSKQRVLLKDQQPQVYSGPLRTTIETHLPGAAVSTPTCRVMVFSGLVWSGRLKLG